MIPVAEPLLGTDELNNVIEAIKSGWVSSAGKFIPEFEDKFAAYCSTKYGIATSNGTTALHLALSALGITEGDEVIVPTLTFIATANSVTYIRAKPVFIDSHKEYWCIDPEKIEDVITPRTRAIIPVHLYGHPCDMDPIMDIAKKHHLFVIEDAAEAHGAEYKGKKVGSFGDVACYSFFGNKIITTGEGGMCLTDNEELAEKMRILRNQGMNPQKRYWYDTIGFNYRMTNLQAAVGVAQLNRIDEFIDKKRRLAEWYDEGFRAFKEKRLIKLHPKMTWANSIYWAYSVIFEDGFGLNRDEIMARLKLEGIETRPLFYPIHIMPPYNRSESYPVAEELGRKGMSLPSSVNLTAEQVHYITDTIRKLK